MSRLVAPLLLLALAVGGCQPRDPLEWKIHAATPGEFDRWQDRYQDRLPTALRGEFVHALIVLSSSAGAGANSRTQTNLSRKFCQRIDGKTIRATLVDAYYVERQFLLNRRILGTDNMLRNLKTTESLTDKPEQLERFENAQARQEFSLGLIKERLSEIDQRLRALETPAR